MTTTTTSTENRNPTGNKEFSAETVMGFVILGLFATGAIGLEKASEMQSGFDVLLCLLGSVAAFGAVAYIYLRKQ